MARPLDADFNYDIQKTSSITEGGCGVVQPKQVKGGVFSTADFELVKRSLFAYRDTLTSDSDDAELTKVANLLHRLNRVT